MKWKSTALVAVGIASGYVFALLIHSEEPKFPPDATHLGASVVGDSKFDKTRDDLERRIADLTSQLDILRSHPGIAAALPASQTPEERRKAREELGKKIYTEALQKETDQLIAAGFTMDRIQWLRSRSDELEVQRRKIETDRREKGLPGQVDLAYAIDSDLDLRNEIGAEEYDRYRQALGRPNGIQVSSVLAGGIADTEGLKPGDQIVKYDGQRVYNIGQVNDIAHREAKPGERLMVELMRDGQAMQIAVPAGDLGISYPPPVIERSKVMRIGILAQGTKLD